MYELHSFVYLFGCLPVAVSVTGSPGLLAVGSQRRGISPASVSLAPWLESLCSKEKECHLIGCLMTVICEVFQRKGNPPSPRPQGKRKLRGT